MRPGDGLVRMRVERVWRRQLSEFTAGSEVTDTDASSERIVKDIDEKEGNEVLVWSQKSTRY